MFGRLLGNRVHREVRRGLLPEAAMPPGAGLLGCRVQGPEGEPVVRAETAVTDTRGRTVVAGSTDPYGSFMTAVPAGEYRLTVRADGYLPYRTEVAVAEGAFASLGDVALRTAPPAPLPAPGDWEIEPAHTSIGFTARHIGLARIHGRSTALLVRYLSAIRWRRPRCM